MKTLYEQIVDRVKVLDKLSSSKTKGKDGQYSYSKLDEFKIERVSFIEFCLENKITYDQIACILDISKGRVYQIAHYKETGVLTHRERVLVRKRDKHVCVICGVSKNLQIHHVHNPLEKPTKNLITLCAKHHRKVHTGKLTPEELNIYSKKVEFIKKKKIKKW